MKKYFLISLICFYIFHLNLVVISQNDKKQIAIIGAGVGGTSCAYLLNKLIQKKNIEVHIYEQNEKVGGRLISIQHGQHIFEVGATSFPWQGTGERYTIQHAKKFNLPRKTVNNKISSIYCKQKSKSKHPVLKLLPTCGFSMSTFHTGEFLNKIRRGVGKVYDTLDYHRYKTVMDLIEETKSDEKEDVNTTILEWLKKFKVSEDGIKHNKACLISILGQFDRIPGLAASPAIRRCVYPSFTIKTGNQNLAQSFFDNIKPEIPKLYLKEKVVKVERIPKTVKSKIISINEKNVQTERIFDIVIIATPLAPNLDPKIEFKHYQKPIKMVGRFQKKVIQIVRGNLKKDFIGQKNVPLINIQDLIVSDEGENINHIMKIGNNIWRIQSNIQSNLDQIFDVGYEKIAENITVGYPDYSNHVVGDNEKFVLDDNLLYLNSIEWAASSVEMSIIGAKNIAQMIDWGVKENKPLTDSILDC